MESEISNWYRKVYVTKDRWAGYEVRKKYIFWPWSLEVDSCNTHLSRDKAEEWAWRFYNNKKHYI